MTASASGLFGVNAVPDEIEPRNMLGVFGTNGLTTYFGMTEIGRPSFGENVLVSAAAGATGSIATQIARSIGCRTIGIASGQDKCEWVREKAGLDACIDYRSGNVALALKSLAPDGIDVYSDNVGGELLEVAVVNLADHSRIVRCGAVATGHDGGLPTGSASDSAMGLVALLALVAELRLEQPPILSARHADLVRLIRQGPLMLGFVGLSLAPGIDAA